MLNYIYSHRVIQLYDFQYIIKYREKNLWIGSW